MSPGHPHLILISNYTDTRMWTMGLLMWLQKLGRCLHKHRQRAPPWHGTAPKVLPCPEWAALRGCRPLPLRASSPKPRHSLCSSNQDTRYSSSTRVLNCAPAKGVMISPKWSFGMTVICFVMGFQPSTSDVLLLLPVWLRPLCVADKRTPSTHGQDSQGSLIKGYLQGALKRGWWLCQASSRDLCSGPGP